ncbi:MAG: sugar ABC transporter permease, partial [Chloroflexaceae bacterium]|nr:sugar ABC transporter permease [Chloroflexaceae bacterium]
LVTALFVLLTVPPSLALGLALALLLNRKLPGIALFRTIFYLPAILPSIATLTIWKFVFNPQFGLANALLTNLGLPTSLWLGSEQAALPTMALIGLWGNVGANVVGGVGAIMIIFLGALQAVPQEIYEAAEMDGAGRTRMFLRMTLPMISPIIFLQLVLQIISALQAFNQPAVLTKGGPNDATNLLMFKIYTNGFGNLSQYPDLGYAIAQVLVLFALIVAVTTFTFRFSSMWVYEDSTVE